MYYLIATDTNIIIIFPKHIKQSSKAILNWTPQSMSELSKFLSYQNKIRIETGLNISNKIFNLGFCKVYVGYKTIF